jgi:serine/threonine-protein kinase haspin
VEGKYPEELLTLWDEYNEEKVSENERPDSNLFSDGLYSRQQRFIALEYEHGGEDLEKAVVNSALQGMSIFLQVAHSMAGKTI